MSGPNAGAATQLETVTVAPPPGDDVNRLYVLTYDLDHGLLSPTVVVIDGRQMRPITQFAAGNMPQLALSPDHAKLYISSTYFSRMVRGTRADVVEIYDTKTLAYEREILLPAKRSNGISIPGMLATSSDGKYLLVQNATPASSVSVVDIAAGKTINEIGTAGCWSIQPSAVDPKAFSTFCGDGTVATIHFSSAGAAASSTRSPKLFDPEDDPLVPIGAKLG